LNYLYFTDIRPDAETYNANIAKVRPSLVNAEKNPNTIFMQNVYNTWYDNNPAYAQIKVADLDAANYENMLKVAKKHLANAADFTFTFVGNVDIDALRPLVAQYIASLPANKKQKDQLIYTGGQAKGQVVNDFDQEMETPSTSVFNVYHDNNIEYTIENEVKMNLLSDVLDIIFTNTLREEEGGTYSPATQAMINPFNNEWTVLYMFVTGADSKEKLCKRAHEEFLKLLAEGTNEENFNKVKDAALNQYQINSKNNSYWQDAIYQNEMGWDTATNHEAAIKNLTLDEFNKFIKTLYNNNNRIQIIMNGVEVKK
jgi:zinc protease